MALDHARHFFHWDAIHGFDPLDLSRTSGWLFFTRWITHYCAPIFSFLAGTGAYLAGIRGRSKLELSWFLVTRGLWLVVIELTLLTWFGWRFAIDPTYLNCSTLWALGWSMIVLAALVHLPVWAITAFGLVLIFGHNALDAIRPESWGSWAWLWSVLHVSGTVHTASGFSVRAYYPLIPWIGVMATGYGFGTIYRWKISVRRRWLLQAGLIATLGFVVLRLTNVYGNLTAWTHQARPLFTFLSFLDCTKYPPSVCYLLMTLGPGLVVLSLLEGPISQRLQPFIVYGRVPFFYYLLHIPLLHLLAVIVSQLRLGTSAYLYGTSANTPPPDAGFSLPMVYLVWITVVVALYPACRWFVALKRRRREAWLSYF